MLAFEDDNKEYLYGPLSAHAKSVNKPVSRWNVFWRMAIELRERHVKRDMYLDTLAYGFVT